MTNTAGVFDNENLFLLQRALKLASDLELSFKNPTRLATFCAHHMSIEKPNCPPVNISTLTRNPIYRALLEKQLAKNSMGHEFELLSLRLENSNLKESNKRKDLYINSLDRPSLEHTLASNIEAQTASNLDINYLIKIIDLLLDHFSDHITIDRQSGEIICPYLTSSARIVVPKNIAKYYTKTKL
jgi:hypothetical protein